MTSLYFFTLLGSTSVKAERRTLMNLTPGGGASILISYGPSTSFWNEFYQQIVMDAVRKR